MIEYQVLTEDNPTALAISVMEALGLGWELQGGVAVSVMGYAYENYEHNLNHISETIYAQAMFRRQS